MRKITKLFLVAQKSLKRFPVCFVFIIALTLQLTSLIITDKEPNAMTFFLSIGILVGLLLHLLSESKPELAISECRNNGKTAICWVAPFTVLGIDSFFLHQLEDVSNDVSIAHAAAIFALLIAVCFLPFKKEKDDRKSWNFVLRLFVAACTAMAIGFVMYAGLCLLYYGSSELFNFKSSTKFLPTLMVWCLVTLTTILFFIRIPEGKEMHCTTVPKSNFLLNTTRFLFLPLTLLYIIVLYLYGIKIVFTLTLPKGMLSILVSTVMFGLIGLTFLLYPYIKDENHKGYEVKLMQWLPIVVLPLLILMSVGIGRRFYDYGTSANRLYLITLNIWFYVVAIGLWINRMKRIHWVSISFAAILVLTSCHPWNYNSIYRDILIKRIAQFTEKYDFKLGSINQDVLRTQLKKMSAEDAKAFYTSLSDMESFDLRYFHKKISSELYLYRDYGLFMEDNKSYVNSYSMKYEYKSDGVNIPDGFKHVKYVSINYNELTTGNTPSHGWEVDYGTSCNDSTFIFHSSQTGNITITHRGLDNKKAVILTTADGKARFQLTELHILDEGKSHEGMRFTVEGYCFYN